MTGLFTLTSGLHSEVIPDVSEESFIREITAAGASFAFCGEDFSSYGSRDVELLCGLELALELLEVEKDQE